MAAFQMSKPRIGQPAPDFELPDQNGAPVRLSQFRGRSAVVLFFYPKDDTTGCTKEACRFRDEFEGFQAAGAQILGISSDSRASHAQFVSKYSLPFTLLSDEGGRAMLDRELFNRLAAKSISIDMINVNDAGVFFVCDDENVERVRAELHNLNLALRVRSHCAKLSIVGAGMRGTPGVMAGVVRAVTGATVEIIHSTDSNITISVLVPDDGAARAEQALHDFFALGPQTAAV